MISKDDDLYLAIEDAIYDIFNADIPLDDPTETTNKFVAAVNRYLNWYLDEDEE